MKENSAQQDKPAETAEEWTPHKRWNPFNSYKLLSHVHRWKKIKRGRPIPPPVLVTIDPINICNFDCVWCNAAYIRKKRHRSLSRNAMKAIAGFLGNWEQCGFRVEGACIAGGGEPMLNPDTPFLVDRLIEENIEVGIVTNGTRIDQAIDSFSQCTWLGVSMDAGTPATFDKLKQLDPKRKTFDKIITDIERLVTYSKRHFTTLGKPHPAYGVSYKYLLYDQDNIGEIYQASKLAKEIGCKNIHFRPAGTTWDNLGTDREIKFSSESIQLF